MKRALSLLVGTAVLLSACQRDLPTGTELSSRRAASPASTAASESATTRYIVVFRPGTRGARELTSTLTRAFGVTPQHTYTAALQGFSAELPPAALEGIARNPNVLYIEPDAEATIADAGTRTLGSLQWGLDRIDQQVDRTRDYAYGYQNQGDGVEVYILDTGIRYSHQEYAGRAFSLYDWVSNDPDAEECHGHGTHVAGTVGGNTVGVANRVTLYGARVLDCNGSGSFSGIIAAIDSVTKRKLARPNVPMVGNMSLGGSGVYQPVIDAVENSVKAGVVWAIAAGNSNADACTFSPAAAPSALTVAAANGSDTRSSFSNYGSCTDLFAPGEGIWSSVKTSDSSYESWAGTSMATPHVAGVAALYLSANPTATASQVNAAITAGATANVISGANGSPNRLLYSLIGGPSTPPPPATYYTLTAATSGSGSITGPGIACGTAGADCSESLLAGASVTLTATPDAGQYFAGWSGACAGTAGSCTVSMAQALSVTASFAPIIATHIGNLEGVVASTNKSSWSAAFTATVHTASEAALSGATVSVSWSGAATGSGTCTTGASGSCTITRNNIKGGTGSITFRVVNVTKAGTQYTAVANHDANGNSNGTQFTVTR